ncbi:Small conductance calcium-activated potassium channel protein 1 [Bienertia sinuspersici]
MQDFLALLDLECIIFTLIVVIHLGCLLIISVCIHADRSSIALECKRIESDFFASLELAKCDYCL